MASEMVERGRLALIAAGKEWITREGDAKDGLAEENDMSLYEFMFRAALAAMREPTEEMKQAGIDTGAFPEDIVRANPWNAEWVWQAMIDEALK